MAAILKWHIKYDGHLEIIKSSNPGRLLPAKLNFTMLITTDPNDVDSPRNSMNVQAKYGQIVQSQSVTPNAEDLSVILGNMQVCGI